jgi:hypothetical protein
MMQKYRALAQKLVVPTAALFALSVLLQAFFAGGAALIDPQYWALHVSWVGIFQWLSVVLAAAAWAGGRGRIGRWGSLGALAIIAAQYTSIHAAIRHGLAWLAGLHAVGGFVLFGLLVLIVADGMRGRT